MSQTLLFLDLETTGLDPNSDVILELAAFEATLSNGLLSDPGPAFEAAISFTATELKQYCPQVVQEMHKKSGLWAACQEEAWANSAVVDGMLDALFPDKYELAGFSVHFDLSFIKTEMPKLAARLSHRVFDVSTLRTIEKSGFRLPPNLKPEHPGHQHRALKDCYDAHRYAQHFLAHISRHQAMNVAVTCGLPEEERHL